MAKELEIKGIGKVYLVPVKTELKGEHCDPEGNPVISERVGVGAKTVYKNSEGVEIPRSQVCKKFNIKGEDKVVPRLNLTKQAEADIVDNSEVIQWIIDCDEKKGYGIMPSEEVKEILDKGKSLSLTFVGGSGWKMWRAALTRWSTGYAMVCVKGNFTKALEHMQEDTVQIEIMPEVEFDKEEKMVLCGM